MGLLQGFSTSKPTYVEKKSKQKKQENKNPLQTFSLPADKNHKMHVETDELKVNMNAAVHYHVGTQQHEVMGCCNNLKKK